MEGKTKNNCAKMRSDSEKNKRSGREKRILKVLQSAADQIFF